MKFPPVFLERLRSHFLMSEIVGKRIPIKKHGREYHALCPFHNEKSPSFTVNDEKGFYHCFGCGAHGDAVEFVKQFDRLTYPETIELLAREAGLPMPVASREESRRIEQQKTLYDVVEAAAAWFESQLITSSGAAARDYIERRGLNADTIRSFRIGYAPEDRNALHQHLNKLSYPQALQAESGLIIQPEGGGAPYDRFRGRVMFPIRNSSGKVVAFGGRLLASGATVKHLPKYLNSPETPLFKKGELLYNLDLAKRAAREGNFAVVMEGYMDVVSTAQSGIGYAVATLGTAVSAEHLRLLWQIAKEPVMCLDGDAAGLRAMMRTAEVALPLLQPGYSLRFAILPKGEDPDSYVQKHGKVAFERLLITSRRLSQLLWETVSPRHKLDLPEGRSALEEELKQLTDKITNQSIRQHYASHFRRQIWATATSAAPSKPAQGMMRNNSSGKSAQQQQGRSAHVEQMVLQHHSAALETLSRRMLKTLLMFPQLLHKSQVEEKLHRMDIRNGSLDALRNTLLGALAAHNIDDNEAFHAYINAKLPSELLTNLLNDSLNLPFSNTLTEEDATLLWNESASAYRVAQLQTELQELQESMNHNMDEAGYHRLVELQSALKQANAERNFSRAETDVA